MNIPFWQKHKLSISIVSVLLVLAQEAILIFSRVYWADTINIHGLKLGKGLGRSQNTNYVVLVVLYCA